MVSGGSCDGSSRAGDAAGEDAQQPVGQIVEVALALAPIGIVLAQHARARAVLHALDRGFRRQAALDRLAQPPHPALVVGEHAVGLEHVAVLAGAGQVLVIEHLVERSAAASATAASSRPSSSAGSSAMSCVTTMRGSCSTTWPSAMPSEIGSPSMTADSDLPNSIARAGARDGAGDEMLGDDHRGRLQHLDVLVGVFLLRAVLHHEHAQHLRRRAGSAPPAASDRSPRPSPAGRRTPGGSTPRAR